MLGSVILGGALGLAVYFPVRTLVAHYRTKLVRL
jgi:hypothetical protein